ncbi:MAG: EAL domain-containing protein [Pseudorhodoplanes sp.]|nr:EAL domain-containing protein [Pseudorhodoplanes sp.]
MAGVLLAGTPMALFNYWVNNLILEQTRDDVDSTARRSITLAEGRIGQAMSAVEDLARRDITTCSPEHIDALRRAKLGYSAVSEFSILDASGRTLCSDLGIALRHRIVLSSETVADSTVSLDVMVVDDKPQRMLRVRRPTATNSVAALIPGDLLIAHVSTQGGLLMNAHGRIATTDGTILATVGPVTEYGSPFDSMVVSTLVSKRFGVNVTLTRPESMLSSGQEEIKFLGSVVNGVIAIALLTIGILVPWRQRNNPVAELERALNAGEFIPYYQPVVDITTGRLRGCEVLMRWRKTDGTVIPPASFIPLAESSGLILEMTRSLMRKVSQELGPVSQTRPNLRVGFNLAAQHFSNDSIVEDVRKIFEHSQINLTQIVLEVTERQPLDDLAQARHVIAALQQLGVKIAIDDIGAGHSGLSYILKLGVDVIKLDKMFVDALGSESNSTAIIETLVELARNMDIEIIAEGVETFEQVIALRERGVEAVQGYVFAPPLPGTSFLRLLEATDHQAQLGKTKAPATVSFGFGYLSSRRRANAA